MKLGSDTGSVMNHLYSRMTKGQPEPVEGMGVTFLHWTDRSAGTIVSLSNAGKYPLIWVRGDHAKRTDNNGFSECQTYEYTPNPSGKLSMYRFKNNRWEAVEVNKATGRVRKTHGPGLRIGDRDAYHDFSF